MKTKLNESLSRVSDYLDGRKSDCVLLTNITRSNVSFLGFALAREIYSKVVYINSSGYEEIKIENSQINSTLDYVGTQDYFSKPNASSLDEVYSDYSELRYSYSKHVMRYSKKSNDGVVMLEFNISYLLDLINSVEIRGEGGLHLAQFASGKL